MALSIDNFIKARRPRWERFETLLEALEKGHLNRLEAVDLLDLHRLYREATADLARLQSSRDRGQPPGDLEHYLNQLVARAHAQVYGSKPAKWAPFRDFMTRIFPATFRATAFWTLLATAVFFTGFLYGFAAASLDDGFAPLIVPPHLIHKVESGEVWFDSILAVSPLASSQIMTNNIAVTFLAFALGMTLTVGTIYIMAFNGLLVGTLAALCHSHGLDLPFWSFVLPHGVIELTAIFISGGAGMLLGSALIAPGDLPRKDALVNRGRQAVQLILGCVPLLVGAGIIEGFFSPSAVPAAAKFIVAATLLALLGLYLLGPTYHKSPLHLTSK